MILTRRFQTRILPAILIIFLQALPSLAGAEEITVVTEVWPPFRIEQAGAEYGYTGIDVDLLREIAGRMKVTLNIRRLPWARCLDFMKSGKADMITGLAYTPERAEHIHYSKIPYYVVAPAFYLASGKGHLIKTYWDLYNFTIGYSLNSAYFEPFNSDTKLKKMGVSTEKQLIKMLVHGHLPVIIGTDCNVEYDLAKLGLKDKIEKARYRPERKIELFIGVSKNSAFIGRIDALDRLIVAMKADGTIDRIAQVYFQ